MLATGYKQPDFGFLDQGLFPENFEVGQVLGRRLILLTEGIFLTLETEFVPSKLLYGGLECAHDELGVPERYWHRVSRSDIRWTPNAHHSLRGHIHIGICTYYYSSYRVSLSR